MVRTYVYSTRHSRETSPKGRRMPVVRTNARGVRGYAYAGRRTILAERRTRDV